MTARKLSVSSFVPKKNLDPAKVDLAKKVASAYRSRCKAMNDFAKPFSTKVPLELQSIFVHFMKVAEVLTEENAKVKDWVAAQFEGLSFTKGPPFPAQLYSGNSRIRYIHYMQKRTDKDDLQVKDSDVHFAMYELEHRKAKKFAKNLDCSLKAALRLMRQEFSSEFLEHMGVR